NSTAHSGHGHPGRVADRIGPSRTRWPGPAGPSQFHPSVHVPARAGAAMSSSTPAPSSVTIRSWKDGDDRALAQVLPDPGNPAQLAARALLREPGASPLTRTVVATVGGVVVGA